MAKLILDADGVLLDERFYWNAALITALELNGLESIARRDGDRLNEIAFEQLGMQRLAKRRGCNSNWDLAAVLTRALSRPAVRGDFSSRVSLGRDDEACQRLAEAADALWLDRATPISEETPSPQTGDPLLGFGIDRGGREFAEVRAAFQNVLHRSTHAGRAPNPWRLREPLPVTQASLKECDDLGFELWVCTGRDRHEILGPLQQFGLESWIPTHRVVSGDDVHAAEAATGVQPLCKPHWFSPACATVGFDKAVAAVKGAIPLLGNGTIVYAGDALADFWAVLGCARIGLRMGYIHVRSGVTTLTEESEITASLATLQIVDQLSQVPQVLRRIAP